MELTWLQSLLYGLISGLTDILPVSGQAHKALYLNLCGEKTEPAVLSLLLHLAILAALLQVNHKYLQNLRRQVRLSHVPKRRRKRPLDVRGLMDLSFLKIALIPLVLGLLGGVKLAKWNTSLPVCAGFLVLNAAILFLPVLLRSGNKDSRSMSPLDGLMMGIGGTLGLIPGVSAFGAAASVNLLRGADRSYAVNMALLFQTALTAGLILLDLIGIFTGAAGMFTFGILLRYLVAAACAYGGVLAAVKLVRSLAEHSSFQIFAFYSVGAALFTFIFYLSM